MVYPRLQFSNPATLSGSFPGNERWPASWALESRGLARNPAAPRPSCVSGDESPEGKLSVSSSVKWEGQ